MEKPFVFGVATSGDNFTDREKETQRLLLNFTHGVNTILISPRRWGKTSLVKKVAQLAQTKTRKIVYLDIFSCRTESEFYRLFATSVLKQTSSKWDEWVENTKQFLAHINPKISIGTDPMNDFSISFEYSMQDNAGNDILQLPEKIAIEKGIQIVICIDEFQQISDFEDSKTFQKKLRTVWQLQQHVSYCLFGSKKHLMNELFEKKNLPFYKFGDAIYLTKIETKYWRDFQFRFEKEYCFGLVNLPEHESAVPLLLYRWCVSKATRQVVVRRKSDCPQGDRFLWQARVKCASRYFQSVCRYILSNI